MGKPVCRWTGAVLICMAVAPLATAQEAPAPRITLSHESWDFGTVWHLENPTFKLLVTNDGTADLSIQRVHTTCGCTVAQPRRNLVPPGQSTVVKIRFDTKGKQNKVSSKVIILSNDPQRPRVEFPISIFVKRAVLVSPSGGLGIRSLDGSPGLTASTRLENQTDQPMRLQLESKNISGVEVELNEITPGLEYDLLLRTTRQWPRGITRGTLRFSTGLEREKRLDVPVRIKILALVEPSPPVLWLNPRSSDKPREYWISVNYYGSRAFQVTGATCAHRGVKVTLGPVQTPRPGRTSGQPKVAATMMCKVRVPPASELPAEGAKVVFTTNDPAHPRFEVPITSDRALLDERLKGPPEGPFEDVK